MPVEKSKDSRLTANSYFKSNLIDNNVKLAFFVAQNQEDSLYRHGFGAFNWGVLKRINKYNHSFDRFVIIVKFDLKDWWYARHLDLVYKRWLEHPANLAIGYISQHFGPKLSYWHNNTFNKMFKHPCVREDLVTFFKWYKRSYPCFDKMEILPTNQVAKINERLENELENYLSTKR